ncbi:hypothetical protein LCGC14_1449930 [marine sediment metagenome]|uniref:Uncharacterized protein n=1 Tax=marine sediment metagenome TaxID=412755 RepID=A0A0F9K4F6_9ZZZZ
MTEKEDITKLASAAFMNLGYNITSSNPWSSEDIDKMESMDLKEFQKVVTACRFFYKKDSIVSTVINKMIDIGITELIFEKRNLSNNEINIINSLKYPLEEFAEEMALEYLISGLVIPEIKYAVERRDILKSKKIKKFANLTLPVSMWLRDPATIKINTTFLTDRPSYFIIVPPELIFFIMNKGKYPDGTIDKKLWLELKALYPEFVSKILAGEKEILLENDLIVRRRYLTDSPYPIPFLYSAIEPLKHKRNLRRMDYSIASRVISAIQLFRLGDKDFPVTEDQGDTQFDSIRDQMTWRNTGGRDIERIFQLFANHTLQIDWIFPPIEALLDEKKYISVNQDIIFSMGFPRILITGETERTGSSDPEFATISPVRTINHFRRKILVIINEIIDGIFIENRLKGKTIMSFKDINLVRFENFVESISKLYSTGNLSRKSYAEVFGYVLSEELEERKSEKEQLKKLGLEEFEAQPFSPTAPSQPQKKVNVNPQKK